MVNIGGRNMNEGVDTGLYHKKAQQMLASSSRASAKEEPFGLKNTSRRVSGAYSLESRRKGSGSLDNQLKDPNDQ